MKLVKGNLSFNEFEEYAEKFEEEILNTEGVVKILTSDLDEEIPFSGGVFRREYWGKGKRGAIKIKKDLLYKHYFNARCQTEVYEIYED